MWELIFLLIPAGVANMVPPLFANIKREWNWPVDMGLTLKGKRILGDHKTFKGFVVGMIFGQICFSVLGALGLYTYPLPWFLGVLLGFTALAADSIKSFFKRQMNITPGKSWFPWDQIDWVVGSLAIIALFEPVGWVEAGVILIIGLAAHMMTKAIGYMIKVNTSAI